MTKRQQSIYNQLYERMKSVCKTFKMPMARLKQDNRLGVGGRYYAYEWIIKYNLKKCTDTEDNNISYIFIYVCLYHELGHHRCYTRYKHNTQHSRERQEIHAELFNLRCLKKYHDKAIVNYYIRWVKTSWLPWLKEEYPIHYKAFSKIKEYKDENCGRKLPPTEEERRKG